MEDWIEARLAELRSEHEAGRKVLEELRERQANVERTMLRIEGAIEVLEEGRKARDGEGASPVAGGDAS